VPDLFTVHDAAKVRCFAPPAALDALATPPGTLRGRIAPNELVLVGEPGTAGALAEACTAALAPQGAAAMVVDHTDGWTVFSLVGDGAEDVFARISMVPLPPVGAEPAFFMGRIGDVASKAFRRAGRIDFMTGTETSGHVREVLEHAGHAVGMHAVPAPDTNPMGVAR
jgi:hypothetical protein